MNKINCLIVEDEVLAREGLEKHIAQIDFLNLKGSCKNAVEAQNFLNEYRIDLLFLDIEMPKLKGTDFLRTLKHSPNVIFTTAYSQYALESFEFDVIDYLVKPITFERFLQATNKAFRVFNKSSKTNNPSYFFVKDGTKLVKIFTKDIILVESAQNYVNIVTEDSKHLVLMPLKSFLEQVPEGELLLISRGCAIKASKIDAIDGNQITLGKYKAQISRRMKDDVMKKIIDNNLLRK